MPIQNHILTFEKLNSYSNLIHGVSTRSLGSVRVADGNWEEPLGAFAHLLGIDPKKIVLMIQTHSNHVSWVDHENLGKPIEDTDALLTEEKELLLAVRTGDCVPVLLYDPVKEFIAASHAGWRGLLEGTIPATLNALKEKGTDPKDLQVAIAPYICGKCYEVGEEVLKMFEEKFVTVHGNPLPYFSKQGGKIFLDMGEVTKLQLMLAGVKKDHIEDSGLCTKENRDTFFSYRGDTKESFGLFTSLIGLRR